MTVPKLCIAYMILGFVASMTVKPLSPQHGRDFHVLVPTHIASLLSCVPPMMTSVKGEVVME